MRPATLLVFHHLHPVLRAVPPRQAREWDFAKMRQMYAEIRGAGVPDNISDQVIHARVGARTAEDFDDEAGELRAAATENPFAGHLAASYRRYAAGRLQAVVAGGSLPWPDRLTYYQWGGGQVPGDKRAAVTAAAAPTAAEIADWTSRGVEPAALASVAGQLAMLGDAGSVARQWSVATRRTRVL